MKFSIKDFFSKYDQIHSFLLIWSHLVKKSLMESFIFCAVKTYGHMSSTLRRKNKENKNRRKIKEKKNIKRKDQS